MAKLFKGIRLDSAQGIPLTALKYFINKARTTNPHVLLIAELLTCNDTADKLFIEELGITLLIKDPIQTQDTVQLAQLLREYSQGTDNALGAFTGRPEDLFGRRAKALHSQLPCVAVFDCTHDNPMSSQCRGLEDSLPLLSVISFCPTAIGSTLGFDKLLPMQLSIINEKRLYFSREVPVSQENLVKLCEGEGVRVQLKFSAAKASEISVMGEWDNWKNKMKMTENSPGEFSVVLEFGKVDYGKEFCYKFIVNSTEYVYNPHARHRRSHEGHVDNILTVEMQPHFKLGCYPNTEELRKLFNFYHDKLQKEGYCQVSVQDLTEDIIMVLRHNPVTLKSFVLISKFSGGETRGFPKVMLPGLIESWEFIGILGPDSKELGDSNEFITGVEGKVVVSKDFQKYFRSESAPYTDSLEGFDIPSGFVAVLRLAVKQSFDPSFKSLEHEDLSELSVEHINHIMWRCSPEELDLTHNSRDLY